MLSPRLPIDPCQGSIENGVAGPRPAPENTFPLVGSGLGKLVRQALLDAGKNVDRERPRISQA